MSAKDTQHVLLTGPPGVGKTTIVKKVCELLKANDTPITGFYTEELRNEYNKRYGFDVITLSDKRIQLSRTVDYLQTGCVRQFKVGSYIVFPDSFEQVVLPLFKEANNRVLILDEIGKMELISKKFEANVREMFTANNVRILATVPTQKGVRIPLVEELVTNPNHHLITVDYQNRNNLAIKILSYLNI